MSWLELACFIDMYSGKTFFPKGASCQVVIAVTKTLWTSITKHLDVWGENGGRVPMRRFAKNCKNAGAAITCGLADLEGINRRIILDDHPKVASAIATVLTAVSRSLGRLSEAFPSCRWMKPTWVTTGLTETMVQLRAIQPTADRCNWRKTPKKTGKQFLDKPCLFGCPPLSHNTGRRQRKYRVPNPSPWAGVDSGEVICAKCYSWGIGNKIHKRQKKKQDDERLKVGDMVKIRQLNNFADLNGKTAIVVNGESDEGKLVIKLDDRLLRLRRCHLVALDKFVNDGEDDERERTAKAPRLS